MEKRVLAIQSHVVSGYVGNKCAVFPLQLHGIEVDPINSVQFSNHTGYAHFTGQILNADQLKDLYTGLQKNKLQERYSHILSGYVADATFLSTIKEIIRDVRSHNSSAYYVCDPVLGDNGQFYVPESLTQIYRDEIIPLANIITPNQFELKNLSGLEVETEEGVLAGMEFLHKLGVENVVVTSSALGPPNRMYGYGSTWKDGSSKSFRFEINKLDAIFVGTGDVFTSLLLIWIEKTQHNLELAVQKTLATIQDILKRTLEHAKVCAGEDGKPDSKQLELRLIQSKADIEDPKTPISITPL